MTKISIIDNQLSKKLQVSLEGHSGYADAGEDIVCSAISVLSYAIFNGITEVLKYDIPYKLQDGYLYFEIPDSISKEDSRVKVLLDTFVLNLKDLEKQYKDYIKLCIEEVHWCFVLIFNFLRVKKG